MSRKTRKLIWSAPLVAVFAVAGALALFMMLTPNSALAQAEEVPGMPTNLAGQALGPDSIELTWDAPAAGTGGIPDGYRIDFSDDGDVWYSLEPNHNSTVFTDDVGLTAVQTRNYRVFAFNSGGSSAPLYGMPVVTDESVKAESPTSLDAVYPTDTGEDNGSLDTGAALQTHIKLQWTAPDNPPGAAVTKYLIEVSKNGRAFTKLVEKSAKDAGCTGTSTDCEHTHSGLLEMQQRWYRVSAYNHPNGKHAAAVVSTASNSVSHTTQAGVVPAAIAADGVRVGLNPAGRMTLYWDEPDTSADGTPLPGAPIIGYYVYGGNVTTAATDVKKLHFVEANTSLAITSSIQTKFDAPSATEPWNFQVMAVNSVVRRGVADGVVTPTTDGNWSADNVDVTVVNRAKNVTEDPDNVANDLLNRPRFKKNVRVNNVNAGRTDIELEWEVEKVDGTTEYRLERSEDRIDWVTVPVGNTNTDETVTDTGRIAGTTYWYRVFAEHRRVDSDDNIWTEASTPVSVTTAPAGKPLAPRLDSVVSSSETQIDVAWTPPDDDYNNAPGAGMNGSPAVGHGRIVSYEVDVSDNGTSWSLLATVAGKLDEEYTYDEKTKKVTVKKVTADEDVEFFHKGLVQGQTKYYRVSTINNSRPNSKRSVPSDVDSDTTLLSLVSDSPGGLVAKAKDRSSIKIVWNARADDITAAPIIGYKIEYSMAPEGKCDEQWKTLVENTMRTTTAYTHMDLMPGTGYCYRVFGVNVVATSSGYVGYGDDYVTTNDNDAIATTVEAMVPGAPTLTLGTVTDSEINFSWTGPADSGGSAVTGWIVEKAYGGSFLDEMRTNTDAFTDAQTWWDGLDCPAMVAAVMDDGTADMDNPFCAMYADLGDTEETEVERVFDVRYFVIDDATANTYRNFNLQPETERMYRLAAVNGVGLGMWSEPVTATTLAAMPPELTAPTGVTVSSLQNTVSVTWDPASIENADQVKAVLFDDGVTMIVDLKTFNAASDPGAATFTGVDSGTYKVTVASFSMGEPHKLSALMEVTIP